MSKIIIDDDDDMIKDDSDETAQLKATVKQGLEDLKKIIELLNQLYPLMEPFGDETTIDELRILYSEIIPNILIGDYDEVLEGLDKDEKALTMLALNQRRKHIIENLLEKYNN